MQKALTLSLSLSILSLPLPLSLYYPHNVAEPCINFIFFNCFELNVEVNGVNLVATWTKPFSLIIFPGNVGFATAMCSVVIVRALSQLITHNIKLVHTDDSILSFSQLSRLYRSRGVNNVNCVLKSYTHNDIS